MARAKLWFYGAVGVQVAILALVPASKLSAAIFGRTVVLQTMPVDPYSIMSGYYVTLSYEISAPPRAERRGRRDGDTVYVVLTERDDGFWRAQSSSVSWPADVPDDAVVIRGEYRRGRILYGIESYYIPEARRTEVEGALREAGRRARIEVKVGPLGGASISRLIVGDRIYDY